MSLTRDQIDAAEDSQLEAVNVPEWGGDVHLRVMSGSERDQWESRLLNDDKKLDYQDFRARLLVRVLCDESGKRLYKDDEAGKLGKKSGKVLSALFAKAQKVNGLTPEDVDTLTKNS